MKKVVTLLMIGCVVFLENGKTQSLRMGIYSGLNIAYLETEAVKTQAAQFAFSATAGATITKKLNEHFGLQAEINYLKMGERINGMQELSPALVEKANLLPGSCAYANFKNDINLHYLQVPLLVRVNIPLNPIVSYYAVFGPAVSFLVSASSVSSGSSFLYGDIEGKYLFPPPDSHTPQFVKLDGRQSITDNYQRIGLNGVGAGGFQYNLGQGSLFMEMRMNVGLTNIYRDQPVQGENFSNSLMLLLGYSFKL